MTRVHCTVRPDSSKENNEISISGLPNYRGLSKSASSLGVSASVVSTPVTERQFDSDESDPESFPGSETDTPGEVEDTDMIAAQYIGQEEAAKTTEVQLWLEMVLARGLRLGHEIAD